MNERIFTPPENNVLKPRAKDIYRHWSSVFIPAALICFVLNSLIPQLVPFFKNSGLTAAWSTLLYPLTGVGMYILSTRALAGKDLTLRDFTASCRDGRYLNALVTGILASLLALIGILGTVVTGLLFSMSSDTLALVVTVVLFCLLCPLAVWFSVRIAPLPYLLADPACGNPKSLVRLSFAGTRGHVWDIIWLYLTVYLVPTILVAIIGWAAGLLSAFVGNLLSSVLSALLAPYYSLCLCQYFAALFAPETPSASAPTDPLA